MTRLLGKKEFDDKKVNVVVITVLEACYMFASHPSKLCGVFCKMKESNWY